MAPDKEQRDLGRFELKTDSSGARLSSARKDRLKLARGRDIS